MPDVVLGLIPLFGVAISTIAQRWTRRRETTIIVPEDVREQLGDAEYVELAPDLISRLERGHYAEVVTAVEHRAGSAPELTARPTGGRGWTRENITFGAVLVFSCVGLVWSIVVLSSTSSTDANYAATGTLGWLFGYWLQPGVLRRDSS